MVDGRAWVRHAGRLGNEAAPRQCASLPPSHARTWLARPALSVARTVSPYLPSWGESVGRGEGRVGAGARCRLRASQAVCSSNLACCRMSCPPRHPHHPCHTPAGRSRRAGRCRPSSWRTAPPPGRRHPPSPALGSGTSRWPHLPLGHAATQWTVSSDLQEAPACITTKGPAGRTRAPRPRVCYSSVANPHLRRRR